MLVPSTVHKQERKEKGLWVVKNLAAEAGILSETFLPSAVPWFSGHDQPRPHRGGSCWQEHRDLGSSGLAPSLSVQKSIYKKAFKVFVFLLLHTESRSSVPLSHPFKFSSYWAWLLLSERMRALVSCFPAQLTVRWSPRPRPHTPPGPRKRSSDHGSPRERRCGGSARACLRRFAWQPPPTLLAYSCRWLLSGCGVFEKAGANLGPGQTLPPLQ